MSSQKTIIFNGLKYTRNVEGTYYKCAATHGYLHRAVWEFYNGKIPEGYVIHHIDHNKSNNDISNLACMTKYEHNILHEREKTKEQKEKRMDNWINNVQESAKAWHKSEEGREWHRQHAKKIINSSLNKTVIKTCINCGQLYEGKNSSKYCSIECKKAYYKANPKSIEMTEHICVICGKVYYRPSYNKSKTCSKECAEELGWRKRRESKECKEN